MNDEFKKLNVESLYRTLFRIIEEREGVKVKFKVERRNENGVQMQTGKS